MTLNQDNLSEPALLTLAGYLAQALAAGGIIFLYGDLGAGKTTFTRGFLRGLGFQDRVKSPTYTLVEPYELGEKRIFHFDCYRLQSAQELLHIGIEEYFFKEAICLIEWPEKGQPYLPPPDLACHFIVQGAHRAVHIRSHSDNGTQTLKKLKTIISTSA